MAWKKGLYMAWVVAPRHWLLRIVSRVHVTLGEGLSVYESLWDKLGQRGR